MSRLMNLAVALSVSSTAIFGLQASPAHAATSKGGRALLEGELGVEGGAYPGGFHPTAGTVEVEFDSDPLVLEKKVGKSGHFKIRLSPGQYTVIGCGPTTSGAPSSQCSDPQTLSLAAGEVDYIQLVWAYVP
jgi:hypothetical protein